MNILELSQTATIIVLAITVIVLSNSLKAQQQSHQEIRKELNAHREVRTKLYRDLADPARIEADFEKSARLREMRDANRTTLPREGAGPPAKVYRPRLRNQKPGNWKQPRP